MVGSLGWGRSEGGAGGNFSAAARPADKGGARRASGWGARRETSGLRVDRLQPQQALAGNAHIRAHNKLARTVTA